MRIEDYSKKEEPFKGLVVSVENHQLTIGNGIVNFLAIREKEKDVYEIILHHWRMGSDYGWNTRQKEFKSDWINETIFESRLQPKK